MVRRKKNRHFRKGNRVCVFLLNLVNDGLTGLQHAVSVGLFAFRSAPLDRHMAFLWQPQESVGGSGICPLFSCFVTKTSEMPPQTARHNTSRIRIECSPGEVKTMAGAELILPTLHQCVRRAGRHWMCTTGPLSTAAQGTGTFPSIRGVYSDGQRFAFLYSFKQPGQN